MSYVKMMFPSLEIHHPFKYTLELLGIPLNSGDHSTPRSEWTHSFTSWEVPSQMLSDTYDVNTGTVKIHYQIGMFSGATMNIFMLIVDTLKPELLYNHKDMYTGVECLREAFLHRPNKMQYTRLYDEEEGIDGLRPSVRTPLNQFLTKFGSVDG